MKKTNKLLLLVVLLASVLLLSSCKSDKNLKNNTPQYLTVNETSGELFADFSTTGEIETVKNLDAYFVLHSGTLVKLGDLADSEDIKYYFPNSNGVDSVLNIEEAKTKGLANAYKKTYTFNVSQKYDESKKVVNTKEFEFTYVQYNSNISTESKEILNGKVLGVASNTIQFDKKGVASTGTILKTSYVFESNDIDFYEVRADKTTVLIDKTNIQDTGFFTEDELIVNRKYINYVGTTINYELKLSDSTIATDTIDIWMAQAAVPLSPKTATFWNWIFLQMPIAYFMSFVGKLAGGSFALAILITTIVVRTLAWPIYAKTNDMSMKMSLAQPDIDKLNRKYATRKDPESQQKMQMEMMQLYKKHKINMFGCLLPFLQMPIFFAMYEVVRRITIPGGAFAHNVSNTKFFWSDLDSGGMLAKIVLTALVGLSMFALQKISAIKPSYAKNVATPAPKAAGQPNTEATMKMVSYVMIFMMVMTSYITPGLSLSYYWVIGNFYSIAQTIFNRQLSEKKHAKLEEEKLYGRSREIIDAEYKKKGDK